MKLTIAYIYLPQSTIFRAKDPGCKRLAVGQLPKTSPFQSFCRVPCFPLRWAASADPSRPVFDERAQRPEPGLVASPALDGGAPGTEPNRLVPTV